MTLAELVLCMSLMTMMCRNSVQENEKCWSAFGDHQYIMMKQYETQNFYNAEAACQRENASLASVHSEDNYEFVWKLIMPMGLPTWIGLHRSRDKFDWSDGTDVDYIYDDYERGSEKERCIYVFHGWHEGSCQYSSLYFICKKHKDESDGCFQDTTSTFASNTTESLDGLQTTTEMTFEEILEEMTIKKKPVYKLKEGDKSKTIGVIAILILSAIVFGIILLDLATVRRHLKRLFVVNMKEFCDRCVETYLKKTKRFTTVITEMPPPSTPSDVVFKLKPVLPEPIL